MCEKIFFCIRSITSYLSILFWCHCWILKCLRLQVSLKSYDIITKAFKENNIAFWSPTVGIVSTIHLMFISVIRLTLFSSVLIRRSIAWWRGREKQHEIRLFSKSSDCSTSQLRDTTLGNKNSFFDPFSFASQRPVQQYLKSLWICFSVLLFLL